MKFACTTSLCVLLTASFATALRGSNNNHESNGNTNSRRHLLEAGTECVTYMRITDFSVGDDEEAWTCEFSIQDAKRFGGARMVEIDGLTMEEMQEKHAISGGTVLRVGSSSYVETEMFGSHQDNIFKGLLASTTSDSQPLTAGPAVLHVSPDDDIEIEEMDETTDSRHYKNRRMRRERRNRRLAKSTGGLETLVIRVVDVNNVQPPNAGQLADDIFLDDVSLKTQYGNCSHNNIDIKQADKQGFSTKYDGDEYKGIIDVQISGRAWDTSSVSMWTNAVDIAETNLLDTGESLEDYFDLVMVCEPPGAYTGNQNRNWLAYAYVGWYVSVYNDHWCKSVSAQMHEVGHNLGLLHSGTRGNSDYSDTTGMMGYSYNYDDIPKMCFNSAKNYQLGWYPNQMLYVNPLALSAPSEQYILNGVVDYGDSDGYVTIRLDYEGFKAGGIDYYLGYNRKTDFNFQTQKDPDKVHIVEKVNYESHEDRNGPGQSYLMKSLASGEEYSWDIGGTMVTLRVNSIAGKDAIVTLIGKAAPTPPPTDAPPTPPPTNAPQTPPPTDAPGTPPPTNAPQTPPPTDAPGTTSPSQKPTPKPTKVCNKKESATTGFTLKFNEKVTNCTNVKNKTEVARKKLCKKTIVANTKRKRKVHHKCPFTCGDVGVGKCKFLVNQ